MPKKTDPAVMPNRIRELRDAAGMSLRDLAPRVGLKHGSLARLERGDQDISLFWMERIGAVLGVLPADLLLPASGGLRADERAHIDTLRSLPTEHLTALNAVHDSLQPYRHEPAAEDRLRPVSRRERDDDLTP